jgi:hypothetical protein
MLGKGIDHTIEIMVTSAVCVQKHDRWPRPSGVDCDISELDYVELHYTRLHDHTVMYETGEPQQGIWIGFTNHRRRASLWSQHTIARVR